MDVRPAAVRQIVSYFRRRQMSHSFSRVGPLMPDLPQPPVAFHGKLSVRFVGGI